MRGLLDGLMGKSQAVLNAEKLAAEKVAQEAKFAAEKLAAEKAAEKQQHLEAIKAKKLALNPEYKDFDDIFAPGVENKKVPTQKYTAEQIAALRPEVKLAEKKVAKPLDFSTVAQPQEVRVIRKPKTAAEVKAEVEAAKLNGESAPFSKKVEAKPESYFNKTRSMFVGKAAESLNFSADAEHKTNKNFFGPDKRNADWYKKLQLENKARDALKKAEFEADVAKTTAELQGTKKKPWSSHIPNEHAVLAPKNPWLARGSVYRADVLAVKHKMQLEPNLAPRKQEEAEENKPLFSGLDFKRKSKDEVHFDMQVAQMNHAQLAKKCRSEGAQLGLFKFRKPAAEVHVDSMIEVVVTTPRTPL